MTHICYLYVYSYRKLKNVGVSFDPHYSIKVVDNQLKIEKQSIIPDDFWNKGIYSVTSIVGGNGTGKTSILRCLMEVVLDGYNAKDCKGVVVYENNDMLEIYQSSDHQFPRLTVSSNVPYKEINGLNSIDVMYYSGHFSPFKDRDDVLSAELDGAYIASDQWLLIHDLLSYTNFDSLYLSGRMYSYLNAYQAQNNARICELLMLDGIDKILHDVQLPHYILITENESGAEHLANSLNDKVLIPGFSSNVKDGRQWKISVLIYSNIINLIAEHKILRDDLLPILDEWLNFKIDGDILDVFENFIQQVDISKNARFMLETLCEVLKRLVSICNYAEESNMFYISIEEGKEQLRGFIDELLNSDYFLTSKFFDIHYSHSVYKNTILSSGEQEMLNLLSRLYYGIILRPQRISNLKTPTLLLLDEAEIGFHPEWQRRYINLLLQFLQKMKMVKPRIDFQLVVTSHSPIILSDMPLCCVNVLERDKNGYTVVRKEKSETFGENVFNLYRRAFVMQDGLIGAFASEKIQKVVEDIKHKRNIKSLPQRIKLIGDVQIRNYLTLKYAKINKEGAVKLLEEQIKQIKHGDIWK